jgi:hypothetical protein
MKISGEKPDLPAYSRGYRPARSPQFVQPDQPDATRPVLLAKTFPFPFGPNQQYVAPVRIMIVAYARAGCGGRGSVGRER